MPYQPSSSRTSQPHTFARVYSLCRLGIVFFTSKSCSRLAGKMNLLFRSLRANLMLAVWTSRRVSPRAKRVARKRSPGLDWRFGMTLHYRRAKSPAEAKTFEQRYESQPQSRVQCGNRSRKALESKMDHNDEHASHPA